MPRYCFNVHDGLDSLHYDAEELPDYRAARDEAVLLAGQMLKELDGRFWAQGDWRVDVTDDAGLVLCSLMVTGVESPAVRALK